MGEHIGAVRTCVDCVQIRIIQIADESYFSFFFSLITYLHKTGRSERWLRWMHFKLSVSDVLFDTSDWILQLENKFFCHDSIFAYKCTDCTKPLKVQLWGIFSWFMVCLLEKKKEYIPECRSQTNYIFTINVKNLLPGYLIYEQRH